MRQTPFFLGHHRGQPIDGVPDIDITQVERREAEAQDVGSRKSPMTPRAISACMIA